MALTLRGVDTESQPLLDAIARAYHRAAADAPVGDNPRMSPFERRRRAGLLPVADITGHRAPVL